VATLLKHNQINQSIDDFLGWPK